jgi:hypothetical protein
MITLFLALANEAGWSPAVQAKASAPRLTSRKPDKLATKTRRSKPKPNEEEPPKPPPADREQPAGLVAFGISDADLAALPDEEFDAVWDALGKLARARAKAARDAKSDAQEAGGQ